jgi:hypothetical protein
MAELEAILEGMEDTPPEEVVEWGEPQGREVW